MTDNLEARSKKLRVLQERYVTQLPDKLATINRCWLEAQAHSSEQKPLNDLYQQVHNLAGSAGTFGFNRLSEEAHKLEQVLSGFSSMNEMDSDSLDAITTSLQNIVFLVEKGPDVKQPLTDIHSRPHVGPTEGKLVYVVEDDESISDEIITQLKYYGYETQSFNDVPLALKGIERQLPDALILDVQLPHGSPGGPEIAGFANRLSDKNIPTLFVSANDDWKTRLAVVRANGDAFLPKPLDFSELFDRLDALISSADAEPYKIMIVDDMSVLAEHYALTLSNVGMQVEVVTQPSKLLDAIADFKPELILMDIFMPECSGLEAAKIIRQKQELISVPIVFLSTEVNRRQQLTAMQLGGDDFLQKPITDIDLIASVRIRIERFRNLRTYMHHDSLTGLLNHVTIKLQLESEIQRSVRHNEPMVFAMLDIDNFKTINDTYGHPTGDRVIKSLSRLLSQRLRKSDSLGRYGGEEFAIIFPETSIADASEIVEDLRFKFSQISHNHENQTFNCSLSAGLAATPPFVELNPLIQAADDALYQAKEAGRNCIRSS